MREMWFIHLSLWDKIAIKLFLFFDDEELSAVLFGFQLTGFVLGGWFAGLPLSACCCGGELDV